MTKAETARLLALITAFDRRTTGEADVEAWHLVVGDLNATDCAQAVRDHFARSREWLMPADVRQGVARIRRDRLAAAGDPPPDADPDDEAAYRAALREGRTRIADPAALKPRDVSALNVGRPVPPADYGTAPLRAREHLIRAAREQRAGATTPDEATATSRAATEARLPVEALK